MIRKFLNSEIRVIDINLSELNDDTFYIQSEKINDNCQWVEMCKKSEICDLIPFLTSGITKAPTNENVFDNAKIEEYSQIILNNDPFYKYSGCTLGKIIDAKDVNWINRALKEMRNEYIKTRVEYLAKANNLI